MKLDPLNCYQTYLALKNHFTQEKYDFHKYNGKVKTTIQTFYKRKDRFWFEKISRTKTDEEILNFFVANFAVCDDPQSLWIGEIIKNGEENYVNWLKKKQSLSYIFKGEIESTFTVDNFDDMFKIENNKHPKILKKYLKNELSLETMIILNSILNYKNKFDKKLQDPVWQFISIRMKKYSPFMHIDTDKYKHILRECIL